MGGARSPKSKTLGNTFQIGSRNIGWRNNREKDARYVRCTIVRPFDAHRHKPHRPRMQGVREGCGSIIFFHRHDLLRRRNGGDPLARAVAFIEPIRAVPFQVRRPHSKLHLTPRRRKDWSEIDEKRTRFQPKSDRFFHGLLGEHVAQMESKGNPNGD